MKGDFSRDTFDVTKHFSRVLMQQGRVQLDADANEQVSILLHYLRTLAADLIGPHGGPQDNNGFQIIGSENKDFAIGLGRYYVDGIICEANVMPNLGTFTEKGATLPFLPKGRSKFKSGQLVKVQGEKGWVITQIKNITEKFLELNPPIDKKIVDVDTPIIIIPLPTYRHQPDYSPPPDDLSEGTYLVYLDVWERHITCIEDDSIREVALSGTDTCTRTKVVWQVKIQALDGNVTRQDVENNWAEWVKDWQAVNRGELKAKGRDRTVDDTKPCITSPDSRYRGTENQLYRVEIHNKGVAWDGVSVNGKPAGNIGDAATFKWSRENGSVVFPIRTLIGDKVTLEHLGRDERFGLKKQDWVEIVDDETVLLGKPGIMAQVDSINRDDISVTLKFYLHNNTTVPTYTENESAEKKHAQLRRWDHKEGDQKKGGLELNEGAAIFKEGEWLMLEDGVQIQFQQVVAGTNKYRTGDYWLIPARTITDDVEWPGPVGEPEAVPPHGVEHHYAPLAIIGTADGKIQLKLELRRKFEPSGKPIPQKT